MSRERSRTHGLSDSREYRIWAGIKQRCLDPENPNYPNYGGRGISICKAWENSFESFYAEVGPAPSRSHSLDRRDNDRGYEPGNVRWATRTQQANNSRHNHLLTVNSETRTLSEWAGLVGIRPHALLHRLARGWDLSAAVKTGPLTDATRRSNRYLTLHGHTHCISEWAKRTGMKPMTIRARLLMGWSAERALTEPVKAGRHGPVSKPYRRRTPL